MSTRTLAIIRSMSNYWTQFMNYQCQPDTCSNFISAKPMGEISSAISVNKDNSYYSINVKPLNTISWALDVNRILARILSMRNQWAQSHQLSMSMQCKSNVCFNKNQITLHCNQSEVSISTPVFEVYTLQAKVNIEVIQISMWLSL